MSPNSPQELIVDSQDPESICPGGKTFNDCDAAQELLDRNLSYRMDPMRATANGNYVHLLDDRLVCKAKACGRLCHIALEIIELKPSGNARLYCEQSE